MDYRKVPWPALGRIVAALVLAGGGFGAGAAAERSGALPGAIVREPAGVESTFSIFWQAWDLVQQHYVERQTVDILHRRVIDRIDSLLRAAGDDHHAPRRQLAAGFFPNKYAIRIPSAYNAIIGTARNVCVTMSGVGVTTAAMMNASTIAYLNF